MKEPPGLPRYHEGAPSQDIMKEPPPMQDIMKGPPPKISWRSPLPRYHEGAPSQDIMKGPPPKISWRSPLARYFPPKISWRSPLARCHESWLKENAEWKPIYTSYSSPSRYLQLIQYAMFHSTHWTHLSLPLSHLVIIIFYVAIILHPTH